MLSTNWDLTDVGVPTPGNDLTLAGVLAADSGPAEPGVVGVVGVDSLAVEDPWYNVLLRLALSLPALLAITSRTSCTLEHLRKSYIIACLSAHTHIHINTHEHICTYSMHT